MCPGNIGLVGNKFQEKEEADYKYYIIKFKVA